jgi:hypothetical protein
MTYQRNAGSPVPPRPIAGSGDIFLEGMRQLARELHAHACLEEGDADFLQDVARDRYKFVAERRLMAIASRSAKPEHREYFAELVRRACAPASSDVSTIASAFDRETEATGAADLDQRHFERAPCRSTRDRVLGALIRQLNATRASIAAVAAYRL